MSELSYEKQLLAGNLLSWFVQNGGTVNPDVQTVHSDQTGFHMRALKPLISPIVASCPLRLTLSCLNLDLEQEEVPFVNSPLRQCQGKIPVHILTYLFLIEQRSKGTDSPWHAYIACLPASDNMTTPLWFDEADLTFLSGTSLLPAARERKEELHRQWEQAVTILGDLQINVVEEIDVDSLLWAATIFTSRAFISTHILPDRETLPILFPVVDILNHSGSARVEWDFQPHHSFTLKCLDGEHFEPGQELFNNYAPKQNDELLLGYGFCLQDNPVEQFALKLAFQPALQQFASEVGLLSAKNMPFGMSPTFLEKDPDAEQHFLRRRGHPFGRYENHVPFLRGLPPYIVQYFFVQTMMTLELDIRDIKLERPGARITLQILVLIHLAIEQRCLSLPREIRQEPGNEKQKYAKIYRDGQARIIHSVRGELEAVIRSLRVPQGEAPRARATLLSSSDAIVALADFPSNVNRFKKGLEMHKLQHSRDEGMIWTLLLVTYAALSFSARSPDDHLIFDFVRDLVSRHPLPVLEDGIEDADTYTFIDDHFGDFFMHQSIGSEVSPIETLDDIGLDYTDDSANHLKSAFISGPTENLGSRIIMWAMKVVDRELLSVLEEGRPTKCLYVRPLWRDGRRSDEDWVYKDVDQAADPTL